MVDMASRLHPPYGNLQFLGVFRVYHSLFHSCLCVASHGPTWGIDCLSHLLGPSDADYPLHWIHLHWSCRYGGSIRFLVEACLEGNWMVDQLVQYHWWLWFHGVCDTCHSHYRGTRLFRRSHQMGRRFRNVLGFVCLLGCGHFAMYRVWQPASYCVCYHKRILPLSSSDQ